MKSIKNAYVYELETAKLKLYRQDNFIIELKYKLYEFVWNSFYSDVDGIIKLQVGFDIFWYGVVLKCLS